MKTILAVLFLISASFVYAQEEAEVAVEVEPTEPPFAVGDLPKDSGHTIERADAPDLNFRFVNNKMRVYWLDDEGLVVEPEVDGVTVRFTGNVRGRDYFRLERVSDDVALGHPYNILPPHVLNVVLVLPTPDSDEVTTFTFRYVPKMDEVSDKAAAKK